MEFVPGKYDNISLRDYHKMEGWSKSKLDKVNQSMAHYIESTKEEKPQTDVMLFGSLLHCNVLTPDLLSSEFYLYEKQDLRTTKGKEAHASALLEAGDRALVNSAIMDDVNIVTESILKHPIASQLLQNGSAEQSFMWIDPRTGLKCKVRPDYIRNDENIVIDLKTTTDASYWEFQKKVLNFRYHVQGAYFCDGVSAIEKRLFTTFILIAVETSAPYNVAIYSLGKDELQIGRTGYELNLDRVVEYEKSVEKWAGYPLFIQDMLLPPWTK